MTWSPPRPRTSGALAALHTPVTSAPVCLASCPAMAPTAPEAPLISTFSPAARLPRSKKWRAVEPPKHSATASWALSVSGIVAMAPCSATVTYSAWQPRSRSREAMTLSPGWKRVTPVPTASTLPATSKPKTGCFGLVRPNLSRTARLMPRGTRSARTRASPELTVVAAALMSTSPSAGAGFGTSLIWTTSGGPYPSQTAAFICPPSRRPRNNPTLTRTPRTSCAGFSGPDTDSGAHGLLGRTGPGCVDQCRRYPGGSGVSTGTVDKRSPSSRPGRGDANGYRVVGPQLLEGKPDRDADRLVVLGQKGRLDILGPAVPQLRGAFHGHDVAAVPVVREVQSHLGVRPDVGELSGGSLRAQPERRAIPVKPDGRGLGLVIGAGRRQPGDGLDGQSLGGAGCGKGVGHTAAPWLGSSRAKLVPVARPLAESCSQAGRAVSAVNPVALRHQWTVTPRSSGESSTVYLAGIRDDRA